MKNNRLAIIVLMLIASFCLCQCGDSEDKPQRSIVASADDIRYAYGFQSGDVLLIGDDRLRCCNWQAIIPTVRIATIADNETTIHRELTMVDERFAEKTPSKVFLMLGFNELNEGEAVNMVYERFTEYYKKLQNKLPQTEIVIMSQLPIGEVLKYGEGKATSQTIFAYNQFVKMYALENGLNYINLYDEMATDSGVLKGEYDATDGFHLFPNAYVVMSYRMKSLMQ